MMLIWPTKASSIFPKVLLLCLAALAATCAFVGPQVPTISGGIMAGEGGSATNKRNLSELVDFLGPAEIPV